MCPHTAISVYSYCYVCVLICVLILLYVCPHTAIYVSSYCYICVLILLYMCPHPATYLSSYCYICVLILLRIVTQRRLAEHPRKHCRNSSIWNTAEIRVNLQAWRGDTGEPPVCGAIPLLQLQWLDLYHTNWLIISTAASYIGDTGEPPFCGAIPLLRLQWLDTIPY